MDVAYLSAALAGSMVGGLTSGITTWLTQRNQARAMVLARETSRRDNLYKNFIVAASEVYGDALVSNEPQIEELVGLYAMISRMRVHSSPRIVECADQIMRATIDAYLGPNRTVREMHELMKSGAGIDPLKEFSDAAREELGKLTSL